MSCDACGKTIEEAPTVRYDAEGRMGVYHSVDTCLKAKRRRSVPRGRSAGQLDLGAILGGGERDGEESSR